MVFLQDAIDDSDPQVEPHYLWEYPSRALSAAVRLITLDLTGPPMTENYSCRGCSKWSGIVGRLGTGWRKHHQRRTGWSD